jgi:hypothetical protein
MHIGTCVIYSLINQSSVNDNKYYKFLHDYLYNAIILFVYIIRRGAL